MRATSARLQAVLFDMDGLLVDSEPLWLDVEDEVMTRLGGDWGQVDQGMLAGGSLARTVAYMRQLVPGSGISPDELGDWLLTGMADRLRRAAANGGIPLMPGAAALLAEISDREVPCALVTSSDRRIMSEVLTGLRMAGLDLTEVFTTTVCAQDVRRTKPDPEPYLLATGRLGVRPEHCVVLEDSPTGVAAAEAAGCAVIAVPNVVPVPAVNGRTIVPSLGDVDLTVLHTLVAGSSPGVIPSGSAE